MSVIPDRSVREVRTFLHEATGVPVEGCAFERTPAGLLSLKCEYKTIRGDARTKRITMGQRLANPADEVTDLAVAMSEWIEHGEGHMFSLIGQA